MHVSCMCVCVCVCVCVRSHWNSTLKRRKQEILNSLPANMGLVNLNRTPDGRGAGGVHCTHAQAYAQPHHHVMQRVIQSTY